MIKLCKFKGCGNRSVAQKRRGLCNAHKHQKRRHGKTWALDPGYGTLRVCNVPYCLDIHLSMGFCKNHYMAYRRGLRVEDGEQECAVTGCTFVHYAKGLCALHYQAVRAPQVTEQLEVFAYKKGRPLKDLDC